MVVQDLFAPRVVLCPRIDAAICSSFNLLNPLFLAVLVGVILEGRVTLLGIDPPWGRCPELNVACFEAPAALAKAMVRASGHVYWLSFARAADTIQIASKKFLEFVVFCSSCDSCCFGAPWSIRLHLFGT